MKNLPAISVNFKNKKLGIFFIRSLSMIVQLGYIKIYTQHLDLSELGKFFYLSTISYSLNAIIFVPVDYYQQTHVSTEYSSPLPLKFMLALSKKSFIFSVTIFFVFSVFAGKFGKISPTEMAITFFLSFFLFLCTSQRAILNNRGHGIFVVMALFLESSMKIIIFFIFLFLNIEPVNSLLLSTLAALIIEFLAIVVYLLSKERFDFSKMEIPSNRSLLSFCYPVSISAVCNWLQLQGYRLIYVWFGHSDVAGLYAAVSNIGAIGMSAAGQIYSQLFMPKIYQTKGEFIKQYIAIAFIISVTVATSYLIFGKIILMLLTKTEFRSFYYIMLFGVLVESSNLLIGAITAFAGLRGRTNTLIQFNLIGVLIAAVALPFSIYWDAENPYLMGASIGIPQIVTLLFLMNYVRKSMPSRQHIETHSARPDPAHRAHD